MSQCCKDPYLLLRSQGLLVIYLPVWFNLYSYMLSQRRKKVGKRPSATKTE